MAGQSGCAIQSITDPSQEVFIMKYEHKEEFENINVFGMGTANTAYAQFFIGNSFLNPLTDPKAVCLQPM